MKAVFCSEEQSCLEAVQGVLDQARTQVLMQAYTFAPSFAKLLAIPIGKGAQVFLLMHADQLYGPEVWQTLTGLSKLFPRRLAVRVYGTDKKLAHQKSIVVDEKILLTGSYNFTVSDRFNDVVLLKEKSIVASHVSRFWQLWVSASVPTQWDAKTSPAGKPAPAVVKNEDTCFMPEDACVDRLTAAIRKARWKIRVAAPHLTNPEMIGALLVAADRGVKVQIVHGKTNRVDDETKISFWKELPIRENARLHSKFLTIDGTWTAFGSFNFSRNGTKNYENLIFIKDVGLTSQFDAEFSRLWQDSGKKSSACSIM